ncbi:helix-turn-helix transcriptional regulator [Streptomyces sp. NA02950]|uniref:helix-turn-helix transcriptional regulator n=1 Tax=Streptomyces sp. NA02950 TaxID=2742137 RepID=UPI0020CB670F|nr:AAA family ATPase [Streptomyces sp. NA02950]
MRQEPFASRPAQLRARAREAEAVERLVRAARSGQGGALVLLGEAGIGKTTLLAYASDAATGFESLRAVGVEFEMDLPFAALHQLCGPLLHWIDRLPGAQRGALEAAFGLRSDVVADPFRVGLAVLGLLTESSRERPVLCVVDDAQWLDSASARVLSFVARRVGSTGVAFAFGLRDVPGNDVLRELPMLTVLGLPEGEARALLAAEVLAPLDAAVRERIIAEARGNPLALLELARSAGPAAIAGGFGLPDTVTGRIERSFHDRVAALPDTTRRLLLVAAAEPVGDPGLLQRACAYLGTDIGAAAPAEAAGLLELGARVRFIHPLVRSAAYRAASLAERRAAHSVLARATDPERDPDRRAWHRAQATTGVDEDVAAELEQSAQRAQARGGLAAAAAFLEKVAALTPDPARRNERLLSAAQAKHNAGAPDEALNLLAAMDTGLLDGLQHARSLRLRGQISFSVQRGNEAPPLLLEAARLLSPLDPGLARETLLEVLWAAAWAGRFGHAEKVVRAAEAVLAGTSPPQPPGAADLLLDGLVKLFTRGLAAAVPDIQAALHAYLRSEETLALPFACRAAWGVWDDDALDALSTRLNTTARDSGALAVLPVGLNFEAWLRLHQGYFDRAGELIQEADAVAEATGAPKTKYGAAFLAGWRGDPDQGGRLLEASAQEAASRGEATAVTITELATSVLHNGGGRYDAALIAARKAAEQVRISAFGVWALPEVVEAASRLGQTDVAINAADQLSERTLPCDTDWALGVEAATRALIADDTVAEDLYREAIERLGRTRIRAQLARTHLVYGEWLRRQRRRTDARAQLLTAHEMFTAMGAEAFAARAEGELRATGGFRRPVDGPERPTLREPKAARPVAPPSELPAGLTEREVQVLCLAAQGLRNREIGMKLSISSRTVGHHLAHIYDKTGQRTRAGVTLFAMEHGLLP